MVLLAVTISTTAVSCSTVKIPPLPQVERTLPKHKYSYSYSSVRCSCRIHIFPIGLAEISDNWYHSWVLQIWLHSQTSLSHWWTMLYLIWDYSSGSLNACCVIAMKSDPQFGSQLLLLCWLCVGYWKSELRVEKCVLAIGKNCQARVLVISCLVVF